MTMRHETQQWDRVRATLSLVSSGSGTTGKSPTVAIQRIADGQWLQSGGGSWGGTFATNTMPEVDATDLPGLYAYAVPTAQLDHALGLDGYFCVVAESTTSTLEHVLVHTLRRSAWSDPRVDFAGSGTFGEGVRVDSIGTGAVGASAFQAGAIDAAAIGDGALTSAKLAAGAVSEAAVDAAAAVKIGAATWERATSEHGNAGTFGAGVRLVDDALHAGTLAADAVSEIGAAVLQGSLPAAAIAAPDSLANFLIQIALALVGTESPTGPSLTASATDASRFFYDGATPDPATRSASFAGRLAVLLRGTDPLPSQVEVVRIVELGNEPGVGNYLDLVRADGGGTPVPGGVAVGDRLLVRNSYDATAAEVLAHPVGIPAPGTVGELLVRMMALRSDNVRVEPDRWGTAGQPEHGHIFIWASATDMQAGLLAYDPDAGTPQERYGSLLGCYEFTATFNALKQMTSHSSLRLA